MSGPKTDNSPISLASMVGGRITSYGLVDALDCCREVGTLALRKAFAAIAEHGGAAWNAVSRRRALPQGASNAFNKIACTLSRDHHPHPEHVR